MLTLQQQPYKSFPLAFGMSSPGFDDQVLAKLPQKIQKQLKEKIFYANDGYNVTYYDLLTGQIFQGIVSTSG